MPEASAIDRPRLKAPQGHLFSERLELHLVTERDLPALLRVHRVDAVSRYLPFETWKSMEDAELWYEKVVQRRRDGLSIQWAICDRHDEILYGTCLMFGYEKDSQRVEIGYGLGQDAWGKGIASEAVARMIKHAFGEMGLRRLDARVDPRNTASRRLLERLGFDHEGCQRERELLKGELVDVDLFALLRANWDPVSDATRAH